MTADKSPRVREGAVGALNERRSPEAIEPLAGLLDDSSEHVRRIAARTLARLGSRRSVGPMIEWLKVERGFGYQAPRELARLKSEWIVEPLLELLESPDKNVRSAAACTLAR